MGILYYDIISTNQSKVCSHYAIDAAFFLNWVLNLTENARINQGKNGGAAQKRHELEWISPFFQLLAISAEMYDLPLGDWDFANEERSCYFEAEYSEREQNRRIYRDFLQVIERVLLCRAQSVPVGRWSEWV